MGASVSWMPPVLSGTPHERQKRASGTNPAPQFGQALTIAYLPDGARYDTEERICRRVRRTVSRTTIELAIRSCKARPCELKVAVRNPSPNVRTKTPPR